jgi:hypothetical protein
MSGNSYSDTQNPDHPQMRSESHLSGSQSISEDPHHAAGNIDQQLQFHKQQIDHHFEELLKLDGGLEEERRDKSRADLYVRATRRGNSWNAFVNLKHEDLDPDDQHLGRNTRKLSEMYQELSREEKDELRTPKRLKTPVKTEKDQMKKAWNEISRAVSTSISRLSTRGLTPY